MESVVHPKFEDILNKKDNEIKDIISNLNEPEEVKLIATGNLEIDKNMRDGKIYYNIGTACQIENFDYCQGFYKLGIVSTSLLEDRNLSKIFQLCLDKNNIIIKKQLKYLLNEFQVILRNKIDDFNLECENSGFFGFFKKSTIKREGKKYTKKEFILEVLNEAFIISHDFEERTVRLRECDVKTKGALVYLILPLEIKENKENIKTESKEYSNKENS